MLRSRRSISLVALLGALGSVLACGDDAKESKALERDANRPLPESLVAQKPIEKAREPVSYDRDIRPLLSEHCFKCHGPDAGKRQADLRLDLEEGATALHKGIAAIVPGDIGKSELVARVSSDDPDERMPPAKAGKPPLAEEQIALLTRWIEEGAHYEKHWSFVPPTRPDVPKVSNAGWVKQPIDSFILAALEKRGIAPSPEADSHTLLRRAFLDLTGLPPTPEEIAAFDADASPDAYEKQVHRLLHDEPYATRYAERMATPWLDAARYADTNGIHTDAGRQIWPYRDWVLRAFRDGMPFDRFAIEQLAGDLLEKPTTDQIVASGFCRSHVQTDEGGAIPEEYLVEYAVDRTTTTAAVFFGLTFGCARCHDHKYDPVTQEDFYSLLAFFNSIEEPGLYSQLPDSNRAFEPFITVPSAEREAAISKLRTDLASEKAALDAPAPQEEQERAKFVADLVDRSKIEWAAARPIEAKSENGAMLTIEGDQSILAGGANPDQDTHLIKLCLDGNAGPVSGMRLVALEALPDPSLPGGRVGRAFNGNAVLSGFEAEAFSAIDKTVHETVHFDYAIADHEQDNGDFAATNLFDGRGEGWAVDGHRREGGRVALFVSDKPFGYPGGTDLVVKLSYRSRYSQHTLGRVRVSIGKIGDEGLALLPTAASRWNVVGPFTAKSTGELYTSEFGPEQGAALDFTRNFGFGNQAWRFADGVFDGELFSGLPGGPSATYFGKALIAPTARKLDLDLGSDDGFLLYLDGKEIGRNVIDRAGAKDQDKASIDLSPGRHSVVMKIVNTGGPGSIYWKSHRDVGGFGSELKGDLALGLLPAGSRTEEERERFDRAWKFAYSSSYRAHTERIRTLEKSIADAESSLPRSMVMQERAMPRDTYVLMRGQYDKPDEKRKVTRAVPKALGTLPSDLPQNRLGLATWMMSKDSPLVARVTVNRMWEQFFGAGLVRTTEDFGLQGEWPSDKQLLDWLAVEFRESGWDVKKFVEMIVTSATYRQSSRVRKDLAEIDPENRLLASLPRKRLWAEAIRDQALYVSGLLVERLGGPSVKPYQPDGLWQEVAMPASNTRFYVEGDGDALWRRSLYTYWKRACPPPSMLTFDAPTREFCTVHRSATNTPLQALVLWNDEQFVEASRKLAERTLIETNGAKDDAARLGIMFTRVLSRAPDAQESSELLEALAEFKTRYRASPDDASKLLMVGKAKRADSPATSDATELAAWTLVASAILNLDEALTRG